MVNINKSELDCLMAGKPQHKAKKNKFNAVKEKSGAKVYASKKELKRGSELAFQQHCGVICDLKEQPRFRLQNSFFYNGKKEQPINYKADFYYQKDHKHVVEEVKGGKATKTEAYRMRRKMFLKRYGKIFNFIET